MFLGKKMCKFLIGMLFLFALTSCGKDEAPPIETAMLGNESIPVEIPEEENMPEEETTPMEYDSYIEPNLAEIYLGLLTEQNIDLASPDTDVTDGEIAILDALGDEAPELLYIYHYSWIEEEDGYDDFIMPCFALNILSYSEPGGVESVFDSLLTVAAGGGGSYCVYLTREGELMLYCSNFGGGENSWGFWQIASIQNFEILDPTWFSTYDSDLAKLYSLGHFDEEERVYKKNGEAIPKEQYDIAANEIMGDIERVIFQDKWGLYERGLDDLWKDITPFEAESMTYTEATAWLEASIEMGKH